MKTIEVAAAVIKRKTEQGIEFFATQRGYGSYKGFWEFPGGKLEYEETPEEALVREIREELAVGIAIDRFLHTVEYTYPSFHLSMHCFLCHIISGEPVLAEHTAAKWLSIEDLHSVTWLPADTEMLDRLRSFVSKSYEIAQI